MRKVNTKFVLNLNQKTGKFEFKGDFFLLSYYQKGISIHVYMSEQGISFEARPTLGLIWVDTSFPCFVSLFIQQEIAYHVVTLRHSKTLMNALSFSYPVLAGTTWFFRFFS